MRQQIANIGLVELRFLYTLLYIIWVDVNSYLVRVAHVNSINLTDANTNSVNYFLGRGYFCVCDILVILELNNSC